MGLGFGCVKTYKLPLPFTPFGLNIDSLLFVTLQKALDEKFAVVEEKDNEIHQLQLALREKERDLERLNNLLDHNDETINVRT